MADEQADKQDVKSPGQLERLFSPHKAFLKDLELAASEEERKAIRRQYVQNFLSRISGGLSEDRLSRKADAEAALGLLGKPGTLYHQKLFLERMGHWTAKTALELSGLEGLSKSLAEFHDQGNPTLREALTACQDYAKGSAPPLLTLIGRPGVGKSHLAIALGRALCERGWFVLYRTEAQFLGSLKEAFQNQGDPMYDYQACSLFVLDDLGTEAKSDWSLARLDEIVNHRYTNQLPMVVCGNIGPDSISDRIFSRLRDITVGRVIVIKADDYRSNPS